MLMLLLHHTVSRLNLFQFLLHGTAVTAFYTQHEDTNNEDMVEMKNLQLRMDFLSPIDETHVGSNPPTSGLH